MVKAFKSLIVDFPSLNFILAPRHAERTYEVENIKEFIESLKDFENLEGFLEHVGLVMENITSTNRERISLMTMHSAKGLEFDYVFLAGWEEGVFPSMRSIEELGNSGLEEERRQRECLCCRLF